MDGQTVMLYIVLSAIFAAMIVGIVLETRARRAKRANGGAFAQAVPEPVVDETEPSEQAVEARVVEKRLARSYAGVRVSTNLVEYVVVFETDEHKALTLSVPQDTFETIREGDYATLIMLNGNFFYFGEGEEASEDPAQEG